MWQLTQPYISACSSRPLRDQRDVCSKLMQTCSWEKKKNKRREKQTSHSCGLAVSGELVEVRAECSVCGHVRGVQVSHWHADMQIPLSLPLLPNSSSDLKPATLKKHWQRQKRTTMEDDRCEEKKALIGEKKCQCVLFLFRFCSRCQTLFSCQHLKSLL